MLWFWFHLIITIVFRGNRVRFFSFCQLVRSFLHDISLIALIIHVVKKVLFNTIQAFKNNVFPDVSSFDNLGSAICCWGNRTLLWLLANDAFACLEGRNFISPGNTTMSPNLIQPYFINDLLNETFDIFFSNRINKQKLAKCKTSP